MTARRRALRRTLALLVVAGAGSGRAFAQPVADATAMLTPGDHVQIAVWRMPELSGEFTIGSDGTIAHPLYHAVRVTGVPLSQVEGQVRTVLARLDANPQFVVQPLFRVSVGGEVVRPNVFTLPPETSVAQAVAQAGGATEQGRLDRVRLVRDGRVELLDLSAGTGRLTQPIHSGDQIVVERRRSAFRDVIGPLSSVIAGLAGVASLIVSASRD